jgi:hypothetical protein
MFRNDVIAAVIRRLEVELALVKAASDEAADYATHEESRADSKYDTQGLEASYLASGQGAVALELATALQSFRLLLQRQSPDAGPSRMASGSLGVCEVEGSSLQVLLAPHGGGTTVSVDGAMATVVTPSSPFGRVLLGKVAGDAFRLPNGKPAKLIKVDA